MRFLWVDGRFHLPLDGTITPEQCPAELSSSFVISNNVTVILSNTLRGFAILQPQSERRAGV